MGVTTEGVAIPLSMAKSAWDRGVAQASSQLSSLARMARISIGLGAGFAGLDMGLALKDAADLEQRFAKLRRASDSTDAGFQKLSGDLKRFGGYVEGVSLDNLFQITTIGAKLGVTGDALNLFTRDMAKMRVAIDEADLPTEELANRTLKMISVFHLGTDQAINLTSALNALDLMSVASARDILDMSTRMAPMAAVMGLSVQKTMALATAMKQAGVMTEVGGTAIMQVMGRMANKKTAPAFGKLAGVSKEEWFKMLARDPLEAIKALEKGIAKLDSIKAIQALDELGLQGQRVRQALLGIGRVLPELDRYVLAAEDDFAKLTSVQKSNAIMTGTLEAQWMKLANNFKLTHAALGEALLPIFKEFSNGLVRLMHDIRDSIERNKAMFVGWGKWVGEILGNVGAAWRALPLYLDYAWIVLKEKLEQGSWLFKNFAMFSMNYIGIFGESFTNYLEDLMTKVIVILKNGMKNAVTGALDVTSLLPDRVVDLITGQKGSAEFMRKFRAAQDPAATPVPDAVWGRGAKPAHERAMDLFRAQTGQGPNAGLFTNLPDRAAEKAVVGSKIEALTAQQKAEAADRIAKDDAADADARRAAELGRRGQMGPPGAAQRKPRPDYVKLANAPAQTQGSKDAAAIAKVTNRLAAAAAINRAADRAARFNPPKTAAQIDREAIARAIQKQKLGRPIETGAVKAFRAAAEARRARFVGPPKPRALMLNKRQQSRVDAARAAREARQDQLRTRRHGPLRENAPLAPPPPSIEADPIADLNKETKKGNEIAEKILGALDRIEKKANWGLA